MGLNKMIEVAKKRRDCKSKQTVECFELDCNKCAFDYTQKEWDGMAQELPELLEELQELRESKWIPVVTRPLTEEEKQEYAQEEYDCVYECELPEDSQEVLITTKNGHVALTTFYNDYGAYFEQYEDYDDVKAWMPLPEAYKGEKNETN